MGEGPANPRAGLLQMLGGAWITQALHVAAKARFADLLAQGPVPVEELARRAGTEPRATERLLRALAMVGVFREVDAGQFGLSPMAEYLRSDRPDGLHHWALVQGERWHWSAWGALLQSVRTGGTAFQAVEGRSLFEFFEQTPEAGSCFSAAMAELSSLSVQSIARSYDFSGFRRVVDVGGGEGILLQCLLQAHPSLEGVLFDRPAVLDKARARMKAARLEERLQFVPGNFFESVPAGGDAYLLKHILHDWNDAEAGRILRACRAQLSAHARLLIVEYVLPPGNTFSHGKLLDLEMLVMCGGQERTKPELEKLLADNGLVLTQIFPTPSGLSVIEATAA